jgi:hypothetical protein
MNGDDRRSNAARRTFDAHSRAEGLQAKQLAERESEGEDGEIYEQIRWLLGPRRAQRSHQFCLHGAAPVRAGRPSVRT